MTKQYRFSNIVKKLTLIFILFFFCIILAQAQTVIGDTNQDGRIDVVDALRVAQYYVGFALPNFDSEAADTNCSGTIDIIDALLIARFYVGLISEFTDCLTPTPVPPDVELSELIQNWAKEQDIDLAGYQIRRIKSEEAEYMLPGYTFFSVFLVQWPVAYGPPDDLLGTNSIVAINTNRGIELIPDENYLRVFYKNHQIPIETPEDRVEMMKAWLSLSQEMKNDGYYTFLVSDDDIVVTLVSGDVVEWRVEGMSRVVGGGEGYIKATASIDLFGIIANVAEAYELVAGIRPICQSTKLLDKDPVVRKMAEQDLLVMGRSAQYYLCTWREKVSPELKQAIDRIWERILLQEEKRKRIVQQLSD